MTQRIHNVRLGHYAVRRVDSRRGGILRFVGSCLRSGRKITVVVLNREQEGASQDEALFYLEEQVLTSVEHQNVQRILDAGQIPSAAAGLLGVGPESPYFVVQDPSGCSLADQADPRSWGELTRIVDGVLDGLDAIHRGGFIHGSISPESVFRGEPGQSGGGIVIAGFAGTARLGNRPSSSRSGTFAAPEIRVGGAAPASVAMDLFSFGCVVYTFCSGKLPFANGEASSPRAFTPKFRLDPAYCLWMSRLLAADPNRRFQTAQGALRAWNDLSVNRQIQHLRETREELVAPSTGRYPTPYDSDSGSR